MRAISRIAVAALVTLTVAACSDESRVLTGPKAPARPSQLGVPVGTPTGPINPPVFINPNLIFSITAGDNFTCIRKNNLTIYCWGRDDERQLGFSTSHVCANGVVCADSATIVPNMSANFVEAGANHVCTLNSLSVSYCWGSSDQGQIGNGLQGSFAPTVVTNPSTGQPFAFTSISAGQHSTCGNTGSQVFCWGAIQGMATLPTLAVNIGGLGALAVGFHHACVMVVFSNISSADCWGQNNHGQAGSTSALSVVPPTRSSGLGFSVSRITTQGDYTCADQQNGTVQCFGYNYWGTLGNGKSGAAADTFVAQTVGGGMALHGVSTGPVTACALDPNGAAYCWGNGGYGQLGTGMGKVNSATPVPVAGGHVFTQLAVGYLHACGITTDNHIWCWGDNDWGQLGNKTFGSWTSTPVQAADPH